MTETNKGFLWLMAGVWMLCVVIVVAIANIKPLVDDNATCIEDTIEWAGLRACFDADDCSLGDDEMFDMYKLNKSAMMACAKRNAAKLIAENEEKEAKRKEGLSVSN